MSREACQIIPGTQRLSFQVRMSEHASSQDLNCATRGGIHDNTRGGFAVTCLVVSMAFLKCRFSSPREPCSPSEPRSPNPPPVLRSVKVHERTARPLRHTARVAFVVHRSCTGHPTPCWAFQQQHRPSANTTKDRTSIPRRPGAVRCRTANHEPQRSSANVRVVNLSREFCCHRNGSESRFVS